MSIGVLKEIALRVHRMHAPPIVDEHVEYGQQYHKECSRPLGLEANSDHATRGKSNDRYKYACDRPFTLNDKADEQEDEENTAGQLETDKSVILGEFH